MAEERDKKQRILDSALKLLARYGFRRTSVDDIARQAGVAKGTVYLSFEGKAAIFRAVCERLIGQFLFRAGAALAASGPLEKRVLSLLEARFTYVFEQLAGSPHGEEILDPGNPLVADLFERAEVRYRALLAEVLEAAEKRGELALGRAQLTAAGAADLILRAARGCALSDAGNAPISLEVHRQRLSEMTRVILAGLRTFPSRRQAQFHPSDTQVF